MNFELVQDVASEPLLIKSKMYPDSRGHFYEVFRKDHLEKLGLKEDFVQDNIASSKKGVLRGLHYQKNPKAQGKLVVCMHGDITDIVVDIRKGSPNYGKHQKFELSSEDAHLLYVPVGFAHGYVVKSDEALVYYKTTDFYAPGIEAGIKWNCKELKIDWGIKRPTVSDKDNELPVLSKADNNFEYNVI